MSRKLFLQTAFFALLMLGLLGVPLAAQAGGVCGGTYIADPGDTVEKVAAICGTSSAAIYAANPGISSALYAGQSLFVPGSIYSGPAATVQVVDYNNPNYTYPTPVPNYYPPASYSFIYHVQYGDTFAMIAARYGVSVGALWAANPHIVNINFIYPGQIIYVPSGVQPQPGPYVPPYSVATPPSLFVGTVPSGSPEGRIKLVNRSNSDVYVSLQGTTTDGSSVIREYPVIDSATVKVPAAWYVYVAWVGGQKYVGQFKLGGDAEHTITFFGNKVVVD
jgi:LysM repeat protein